MILLGQLVAPDTPIPTAAAWVGAFVVGYGIGAVNPASIVARVRGTDLRTVGSGNPGATNAGRAFGWKVGVLVAVLDILKGYLPVVLVTWLAGEIPGLIAGIAAVLGHISSPYLRGRGGKGVATSLGAVLAVHPVWALVVVAVFGVVFLLTRRVGISSVVGSLALVPCALVWGDGTPDVVFAAVLTVIIVVRHRTNLMAAAASLR
ncbi:MAG: glycerol-3-phosphate 1-O-acyltransferase PlsY [Candidatus Nanopelagicales bacterium]